MNDPMTLLKADHREVTKALNKLADTDEGAERKELLAKIRTSLELHMSIEERLVYPLVERSVGQEDAEEATVEHGLAKEGLGKAQSLVDAPGFGAVVEMLIAGLRHHIEEEEGELLPSLKESMERQEWTELGDAIAAMKDDAGATAKAPPRRRSSKRRPATASR